MADPGPPAMDSSSWSISTTSSISEVSDSRRGSPVSSPAVSVSRTRSPAPTRWATSAASRSLSPKRISSSATASFSFTTGTTPSSSRRPRVCRAWRYWLRWTKSSGASSTWPAISPWAARASLQTRPAGGDGARGHDDDPVAGPAGLGHLGRQLVDGGGVHPTVGPGDRGRPDLHHQGTRRGGHGHRRRLRRLDGSPVNSGWSRNHVNDTSPMWTRSPSRAPALARARSTPRRLRRPCR